MARVVTKVLLIFSLLLMCAGPALSQTKFLKARKLMSSRAKLATFVVRKITVEIRDVFDESDLAWPYRTVNNLKVSTRDEVVKRELLIKEGEKYDQFAVDESIRNLHRLPFVRNAVILPTYDGQFVDLTVVVQDTWTLFPQINLSSQGGVNKWSVGVAEGNLLGYGNRAELLYSEEDNRETIQGVYEDDLFLGSHDRLLLGQFIRADGYRSVVSYGRPFRSLLESNAWVINAETFDWAQILYKNSDE